MNYLGGFSFAGGKMKSTGTTYWYVDNTDATNSSNFSALPGGYRYSTNGYFGSIRSGAFFWSATESDGGNAYIHYLWYTNGTFSSSSIYSSYSKRIGASVRCLRD
jgi:uncharacterized protein (TIGR02145 family)